MNTQTRKVTSRGRAVVKPKRFTPSSLSPPPPPPPQPPQPTNQSSRVLNGTIH